MPQVTQTTVPARHAASSVESTLNLGVTTRGVVLKNLGPNTAYFGMATGVTTAAGFPLAINEEISLAIHPDSDGLDLYLICAAAETASIAVLPEA